MARTTGTSWERYGRRFGIRLSLKRPEELAVMTEYDRRSQLLGKEDKEFLKTCLIAGYKVLSGQSVVDNTIALSNNESNNTRKEHRIASDNESRAAEHAPAAAVPDARPIVEVQSPAAVAMPSGVPAKSILGGLMKHG